MSADALRDMPPSVSRWYEITQERINAFADVTEDRQFIHLDVAQMAPHGGTMAHGFLTLSMLSAMSYDVQPEVPGLVQSLNYGFDRLRFVCPVRAGQRIRGRFAVAEVVEKPSRYDVTWDVSVEIEGVEKPAIVAKWINVFEVSA